VIDHFVDISEIDFIGE